MEEQRSPGRGSQFSHYSSVMALKCGIGMGLGNRRLSAPAQGGGLFFSLQQGLRLSLAGGTEPPLPAYLPASLPLPLLSRPPAHSDWHLSLPQYVLGSGLGLFIHGPPSLLHTNWGWISIFPFYR